MARPFLISTILFALLTCSSLAQSSSGVLYRWTNEQGVTVYSSTLPQEAIRQGREVINTQTGEVIRSIAKPLTLEQRKVKEEETQRTLEQSKTNERFKETQYRLIQAYPDLRSVAEVYQQKTVILDGKIRRLKAEQLQLLPSIQSNLRLAGDHEINNDPVPEQLVKNITALGQRWKSYNDALQETRDKQKKIEQEQKILEKQWDIANRLVQRQIDLTTAQQETQLLLEHGTLAFQ